MPVNFSSFTFLKSKLITLLSNFSKLTTEEYSFDERLNKKLYKEMFDDNGMITDQAVEFASKEKAMNLDSHDVESFNSIIRTFPLLRP